MRTKLKICGMKYNVAEVAKLQPDYLGFIFYAASPRNFTSEIPALPAGIKKVGVFVDASIAEISKKIKEYGLDVIQLHGDETAQFCSKLKALRGVEVWKVFSIQDSFDFNLLAPYESVVDKYLFDTKGTKKGGNGYTFNWNALKEYPSQKPFILSGGIGLEELEKVAAILKTELPIYAIDVNSKFEIAAGRKDIEALATLKYELTKPA